MGVFFLGITAGAVTRQFYGSVKEDSGTSLRPRELVRHPESNSGDRSVHLASHGPPGTIWGVEKPGLNNGAKAGPLINTIWAHIVPAGREKNSRLLN